ncbi:lecithin-cholesterol acyltransferase-like 1 [Nicotiana tomentosiformis]|uniref:Lecithin-cholesterol acyltransferase-like 1 n=1 Tax=Nicotiana tabacum TaxID=4097 RepID=A0A1S3YCY5_TOBAC|nr:lecithin-cholesterol acyltransferase-like 1 [Nicotiana tomentosiformis]XP_016450075.1 PREDICTED: lecithin-cholesterol acyltransferase-like 1 [Nicotiana tabacum]
MKVIDISMIIVSTAMMLYTCQSTANLHPLILVPGAGGNQFEARLTKEYKPTSLVCNRWYPLKKDFEGWFRIWFDPSVLLAPFTKCFNQRMKLYYDTDLDDYYNAPGVQTRVRHFGSTTSLLYLDPNLKKITEYMAPLVNALQQLGYRDGRNLFGAPYDFRYGLAAEGHPSHVGTKFLMDLKQVIETASNSNAGKPVILLSHSLGGLFILQLLNRNPESWSQKYIKHFIALSAPWGGTVEQMVTFASGNTLGVPLVNPLLVREEQRSSESNMWILPSPKVFGTTRPLVITPNAAYSAHDIPKFFKDIGFSQGVLPYTSRILPLLENLTAPQVPVTCIIGSGVKTPETLFYGDGDFDKRPEIVYGDGDGTVNMLSLLAIESNWANNSHQPLKVTKLQGVSHSDILKDDIALEKIVEEISCINSANATGISLVSKA